MGGPGDDEGAKNPEYTQAIDDLSQYLSFSYTQPGEDGWLEAEDLPHQTSSDYDQRGNFHHPKDRAGASQGKVVCADLRMGAGSYIEFVVKIEQAGEYELSVALSAEGPCLLSTAAFVDDALQADSGYPMRAHCKPASGDILGCRILRRFAFAKGNEAPSLDQWHPGRFRLGNLPIYLARHLVRKRVCGGFSSSAFDVGFWA